MERCMCLEMVLQSPVKVEDLFSPRILLYSHMANAECFYPLYLDAIYECKNCL